MERILEREREGVRTAARVCVRVQVRLAGWTRRAATLGAPTDPGPAGLGRHDAAIRRRPTSRQVRFLVCI